MYGRIAEHIGNAAHRQVALTEKPLCLGDLQRGIVFDGTFADLLIKKLAKLSLADEKTAAYVNSLREKGITVVGHFPAVSDSATPRRYLKRKAGKKDDPISDPKAMYAGMQSFVEAIVNRFKDDIHEWSAVAEINLLAGRAPYCRQRYVDVVKLISRSIRKTDPSAEILALGCSGADGREKPRFRFLQGMLPELKDNIDGFGIDQYTAGQKYGVGFTSLDTEQSELREIMTVALDIAKKNGGKIVAIDEN